MGLRLRVVGATVLVLAAAVAPRLRDRPAETESDPRAGRLVELSRHWRAFLTKWSATTERDSLLQRLSRDSQRSTDVQVWLRGFPAATDASRLERGATEKLGQVVPRDSTMRIGLVVYNARDYGVGIWSTYSGAWIGTAGNSNWCVAMVPGTLGRKGDLEAHFNEALSPCLLHAAFGKPGPAVAAWLAGTRYGSVQSDNWINRPKGWQDGYEQPPWLPLYDRGWFEALIRARSSGLWGIGLGDISDQLTPPYQLGTMALRCLAGDSGFCGQAVLDTSAAAEMAAVLPGDLTTGRSLLARTQERGLGPRPLAGWYVSDVIREFGRERFASFWRSGQPIDSAFQTAFGEGLGAWTERWAQAQWEATNERYFRSSAVILGATLKPSWPGLVLLWSALALSLVAWSARRRQVT